MFKISICMTRLVFRNAAPTNIPTLVKLFISKIYINLSNTMVVAVFKKICVDFHISPLYKIYYHQLIWNLIHNQRGTWNADLWKSCLPNWYFQDSRSTRCGYSCVSCWVRTPTRSPVSKWSPSSGRVYRGSLTWQVRCLATRVSSWETSHLVQIRCMIWRALNGCRWQSANDINTLWLAEAGNYASCWPYSGS